MRLDPTDPGTVKKRSPKKFFTAASEVLLFEVGPWAFDRYVLKEDFSYIDTGTIRQNFRTGWVYDHDTFQENQFLHPYHGNLYFNAARDNGYGFWEAAPFALAGSLMWECCMENTPPSINDLVNTTLGGMVRGEIAHRISAMLVDNTETGFPRFVRELAGALYDPVGGLNRIVRGEMGRVFANPEDRLPSRFLLRADLGWRHLQGGGTDTEKGFVSVRLTYGDPFGRITTPFEFFDGALDVSYPGGPFVSLLSERGMLAGWPLTEGDAPSRQALGVFMHFDYVNNASQVVGAQRFSLGLLSVYRLGKSLEVATDLAGVVTPLEGVQTTNFNLPESTRNYDYAPGAGARGAISVRSDGFDFLSVAYGITWDWTVSGASRGNKLQYFSAEARIPAGRRIALGAASRWYSRETRYSSFAVDRRTQNELRVFLSFKLGEISAQGTPPSKPPSP
jgi:hypothetical protein